MLNEELIKYTKYKYGIVNDINIQIMDESPDYYFLYITFINYGIVEMKDVNIKDFRNFTITKNRIDKLNTLCIKKKI
jgi:hypothetical protein